MRKQPSYEELRTKWYKKLKDKGFVDIEHNEWFHNHDRFHSKKFLSTYKQKEEYFQLAQDFLNIYKFDKKIEEVIWEYHVNGLTIRNIAEILKRLGYKRNSRGKVWDTIKSLRQKMFTAYQIK